MWTPKLASPFAGLIASLLAPAAFSQSITTTVVSGTILSGGGIPIEFMEAIEIDLEGNEGLSGMVMQGLGGPEEAAEEKPKVDQAKLKRFNSAPLDRRASQRLAIWSKPEPLPVDDDPELVLPEEPPKLDTLEAPQTLEQIIGPKPKSPLGQAAYLALTSKVKPGVDEAKAAYDAQVEDLTEQKKEFDKKTGEIKGKRSARETEIFQRHITLGRWDVLPEVMAEFEEAGARQLYVSILTRLAKTPPQGSSNLRQFWEQNTFAFDDILKLIEIAPKEFEKTDYDLISPLLRQCLSQGHDLEEWMGLLREELSKPEEERRITQRMVALLMTGQGLNVEMGEFLPKLDDAVDENDREGLNLLARHFESKSRVDSDFDLLENAWTATLAALAPGEVEDEQKAEALKRAVTLAPRLQSSHGDDWLVETFSTRPERGMEVIATIGGDVSKGMVQASYDPDQRLAAMKLLRTTVDALLEKAPERAGEWSDSLNLLADCWLREAQHSYEYSEGDQMSPSYSRDPYGNLYYSSYNRGYRNTPVRPLAPGELLEIRPDGRWRELLHSSVKPKFDTTVAELFLKVNEEKEAFPYIEQLAKTNPKKANELASEFLNVWIKNNDPNSSRNRVDIYSFSWGYNNRASGIPLTRSKQERNLLDLAEWVAKLKAVPGLELDSAQLMRAFTGSHSYAEVYRIETMEEVFGSLEELEPKTLASMAQTMRANLAGLWRKADVQADAKTNRKKKDIEAEVQRGYAMAQEFLGRALKSHPDDWRMQVARAAMMHDLNNYKNDIQKGSDFAGNRQEALDLFASAASNYVEGIEDLRKEEYSAQAFTAWFYAALGATDIDAIDQRTILAKGEITKIRDMLEDIPGEQGEAQMGMFANNLFTHLSEVNPAIKNRYLEAGFEIVGNHPRANAARKVFDYYADLVTEIELVTSIDGATDVGQEPFGLEVELRYTKEIERESGGFQKYLQNQANNVNGYYNYGRPQENYRDKFEEAARTILSEQFEVLSVTFNKEDVNSKATDQYGWRRTPYAYLLLKARGPEVDRVPPLRLDIDFNDVTGYVVLPIASSVIAVDASVGGPERPFSNLALTQNLDERKADQGVLTLEIKATAHGLVPELESIVDLTPGDFEVDVIDKGEVLLKQFADDEETIVSERIWNVQLKPKEGVKEAVAFQFAVPKDESAEVMYQRYDDANLVKADAAVTLLGAYGGSKTNPWWIALFSVVGLGLLYGAYKLLSRPVETEQEEVNRLPEDINPFTVIGLLRQMRTAPNLADTQRQELDATVLRIERYYFGQSQEGEQPDLSGIARDWVRRA